jgi:phosphatidylserine decarboxylase
MKGHNGFKIAEQGWSWVVGSLALFFFAAFYGLTLLAIIFLACVFFSLYFFRDPERVTPSEPNVIISPADGVVVDDGGVELDDQLYLKGAARKISIFMSPLNVHVNRVPYSGKVTEIRYNPGRFMPADKDKASFDNEQTAMLVKTEKGWSYACIQIAGTVARRILNFKEVGDPLDRGDRFGLIQFGSRVDVYLPAKFKLTVNRGQKVTAGETVIGEIS